MLKTISLDINQCKDDSILTAVTDAGFAGLDVGLDSDESFSDDALYLDNAKRLREQFDRHGLTVYQVHLPGYHIFTSSETVDQRKERIIKNALGQMSVLGARWGAFHPLSATDFNYDEDRAMHDNEEKLKRYLSWAEHFDVGIAVENLPVFPDCPQYSFFTSKYEQHVALVDRLDSERIGICWDFGHANLMHYDMAKVLAYVGDRVKIVHMHNNYGNFDMHLCPFIGTLDWKPVTDVLRRVGYNAPINLELKLHLIADGFLADYIRLCGTAAERLRAMCTEPR